MKIMILTFGLYCNGSFNWFVEQVKHVRVLIFECRESSHKAFRLGLAAVVLLSFAHVIANLLGGCICFGSKAEMNNASPNKQLAVASLIFSWYNLSPLISQTKRIQMLIHVECQDYTCSRILNADHRNSVQCETEEILRIDPPSPVLHRWNCLFHPWTLHGCLLCICCSHSSRRKVTKIWRTYLKYCIFLCPSDFR